MTSQLNTIVVAQQHADLRVAAERSRRTADAAPRPRRESGRRAWRLRRRRPAVA
jgi:hypothetical protein